MANPEISIRRGLGWDTPMWESMEPRIHRATSKAARGITYLGLSYSLPKKGVARRFADKVPGDSRGWASSNGTFELDIALSKDGNVRRNCRIDELVSTSIHEITHLARMESIAYEGLLELAASEGLAHTAERLYLSAFYPRRVAELCDYELEFDYSLEEQFLADANSRAAHGPALFKRWFNHPNSDGPGQGVLYGIQCVNRQLEEGYSLADLINQPAEIVLGI